MYCSKCGKEVDENANFCVACGAPVNVRAKSAQDTPEPAQKKAEKAPEKEKSSVVSEPEDQTAMSEKEGWVFTGMMTVMLVAMTLWAFMTAK